MSLIHRKSHSFILSRKWLIFCSCQEAPKKKILLQHEGSCIFRIHNIHEVNSANLLKPFNERGRI